MSYLIYVIIAFVAWTIFLLVITFKEDVSTDNQEQEVINNLLNNKEDKDSNGK